MSYYLAFHDTQLDSAFYLPSTPVIAILFNMFFLFCIYVLLKISIFLPLMTALNAQIYYNDYIVTEHTQKLHTRVLGRVGNWNISLSVFFSTEKYGREIVGGSVVVFGKPELI